jgi:glycosyltransferase involved in cell wall biosynthesis
MLRLLLMINNLAVGGAERYVLDVARALHDSGVDVSLLSLGRGSGFGEAMPVPTVEIGLTKESRDPRQLLRIVAAIQNIRPHIIHTHLQYADTVGQLVGRTLGIEGIVTTIHNSVEWARDRRTVWTMVEDAAVRQADRVVTVSQGLADFVIEKRGVDPNRVIVEPCGVLIDPFLERIGDRSTVRDQLGLDWDAVVFVCSAAYRPEKRHDLLLDRFAHYRAVSGTKAQLLLLGASGSARSLVEQLVRTHSLAREVRMIGGDRRFVAAALRASDIFVMHSEFEGASVAVVEAMASGLPMLLPNLPHFSQQVRHGQEGLLFDFDDPNSFAASASMLARNSLLRVQLGGAAQRRVIQLYGMNEHVGRLLEIYGSLRRRRQYGRMHDTHGIA